MDLLRESDDFEPLARVKGFPVYATSLLVILHCFALITCWTAESFGLSGLLANLRFSSEAVLGQGAVWQWLTYIWVEPVANPLFFAIEMFLLYAFGREVERTLGRRHYLLLYALLVVAPPVLLTLAGFFYPFGLAGSGHVHFAVFLGFALLYPGVEFFLRIKAIWLAGVLLGLYSIYYFANHEWSALAAALGSAATVWFFLQWERDEGIFAPPVTPPPVAEPPADPMDVIDPLLEKIAREGMASLSAKEMAALERARKKLIARQQQERV